MKKPRQQNEAFLADVAAARRDRAASEAAPTLHVWWMGQSGFLLAWQGHHLLLDPYLSDSLTRKYAGTDKPHDRLTERVVAPERLDFIDVVTSSHAHTDHLDPETLQPLARMNPRLRLVCPEAHRSMARERSRLPDDRILGLDVREPRAMKADETEVNNLAQGSGPGRERVELTLGARELCHSRVRFHAVPAAHESIERDAQGRLSCLGFVIECGGFRVYHSGDTVRYEGMVERLKPFQVDIALLPINGRAAERRVAGNLWGEEAAQLAHDIGARIVIPCHFDLFAFNTANPDALVRACERLGQSHRVLEQGERFTMEGVSAPTIIDREPAR